MIYLVRSITIQPGKSTEAFQWAVNIANWINEHYPEVNVEVLRNITGPKWQLHWVGRCDSLAVWAETSAKMNDDPGYHEVISGAEELVVQSTWMDNFYAKVA
jgi:hypothetical protein